MLSSIDGNLLLVHANSYHQGKVMHGLWTRVTFLWLGLQLLYEQHSKNMCGEH